MNILSKPGFLLPGLALSLLGSAAIAVGGGSFTLLSSERSQLYPGTLANRVLTKVLSCELNNRAPRDIAFMDQAGQVRTMFAPETYDNTVRVGGAANDFTILRDDATGHDRIVTAGPTGLHIFRRDISATTSDPIWIEEAGTSNQGVWQGALFVRAADINGDGIDDLVGVGSDGRTLIFEGAHASGYLQMIVTRDEPIYEILPIKWDLDAGLELALFHENGISIMFSSMGGAEFPWAGPQLVPTVIDTPMTTQQTLVVVATTLVGGPQGLLVKFSQQNGYQGPFDLNVSNIYSIVGAEYSRNALGEDNGSELFLSTTDGPTGTSILKNEYVMLSPSATDPSGYDILNAQYQRFGPTSASPTANVANLAIDDFDGDGDQDVFVCVPAHQVGTATVYGSYEVLKQTSIAAENFVAPIEMVSFPLLEAANGTFSAEGQITLQFSQPAEYLNLLPGQSCELLVTQRHYTSFGIEPASTPNVIDSQFTVLRSRNDDGSMIVSETGLFDVTFDLPSGFSLDTCFLSWVSELVVVDANDDIVASGPNMSFGYAANSIVNSQPFTLLPPIGEIETEFPITMPDGTERTGGDDEDPGCTTCEFTPNGKQQQPTVPSTKKGG